MKKYILLLIISFGIFQTQAQTKGEKKAVKQCFQNYKEAILNEEGSKAVEFLSERTIKYYDKILNLSLHADSTKLVSMGLMDRFMIFALRHRTSPQDLRSFDGKRTLIYAIEKGMIGKNSVARNTIGDVDIEGDNAEGQALVNKMPTPVIFSFYKEANNWKLDLTSIFEATEKGFTKLIENQDKEENEFLLYILELSTAKKPSNDIWHAIGD